MARATPGWCKYAVNLLAPLPQFTFRRTSQGGM